MDSKEGGVKMIHCPRANLSNHGFPKAPQILESGASVGLGCDGAAPSNLDIFDEMREHGGQAPLTNG